jgi:hypothetical protein
MGNVGAENLEQLAWSEDFHHWQKGLCDIYLSALLSDDLFAFSSSLSTLGSKWPLSAPSSSQNHSHICWGVAELAYVPPFPWAHTQHPDLALELGLGEEAKWIYFSAWLNEVSSASQRHSRKAWTIDPPLRDCGCS